MIQEKNPKHFVSLPTPFRSPRLMEITERTERGEPDTFTINLDHVVAIRNHHRQHIIRMAGETSIYVSEDTADRVRGAMVRLDEIRETTHQEVIDTITKYRNQ